MSQEKETAWLTLKSNRTKNCAIISNVQIWENCRGKISSCKLHGLTVQRDKSLVLCRLEASIGHLVVIYIYACSERCNICNEENLFKRRRDNHLARCLSVWLSTRGGRTRNLKISSSHLPSDQHHTASTDSRWSSCFCSFTEAVLSHKNQNFSTAPHGIVLIKPSDVIRSCVHCSWECFLAYWCDLWPLTTNSELIFVHWKLLVYDWTGEKHPLRVSRKSSFSTMERKKRVC